MMHFEFPVGALVVLYPSFEFFDRCDACPLKDPIAFGSDTLETREGCGLKQFEMFADPLEGDGVIFCVVLPEGAPEEMPVDVAQGV